MVILHSDHCLQCKVLKLLLTIITFILFASDHSGGTPTVILFYQSAANVRSHCFFKKGVVMPSSYVFLRQSKIIAVLLFITLIGSSALAQPEIFNPDFQDDHGFFGVARDWTPFGGNKWESVWDPQRSFTQGMADTPPGQSGGVYQQIAVTSGQTYRLQVFGKTTRSAYALALGVDPTGSNEPAAADFTVLSNASGWTRLTTEFVARASQVTIFLAGDNTSSSYLWGAWVQFDQVTIDSIGPINAPPVALASADPTSGTAPLTVQFKGDSSNDPDGNPISFYWEFDDGSPPGFETNPSHVFENPGDYTVTLDVEDDQGAAATTDIQITVNGANERLVNGDFSRGLFGWSMWRERGDLQANTDAQGRLQLSGTNHNGGLYQQFITGGAGTVLNVEGFWASAPTVANGQWIEVLAINGPRQPVDGEDVNAGQADVVMIYKNDTWTSPGGWSGTMSQTAAAHAAGSFVADDEVATIILKSGNLPGVYSGAIFDDMIVSGSAAPPPPPINHPPTAEAQIAPLSGPAPLPVSFDAGNSSDPDEGPLSFSWDFGDGLLATGIQASHIYESEGTYDVILTVADDRGAQDSMTLTVTVTAPEPPPDPPQLPTDWDERLSALGIYLIEADVPGGSAYWKLIRAQFESDGSILPPPGGGSESNGTHAIYYKTLDADGRPIAGQKVVASWPTGSPANFVTHYTKGSGYDDYWGNFALYGGWCPYYPTGGHGSYGAYVADAPSDQVWGMGLPCNRHVSYRLTWQYTLRP
jgi:PKD repeat protein